MITLKDFAKSNNLNYSKAYRDYASGKIEGYKDENGKIIIGKRDIPNQTSIQLAVPVVGAEPVGVMFEEVASSRSNKAAYQNPAKRFNHIENSPLPFSSKTSGYGNSSDVSLRDAIVLCQHAYFGFSLFRTTIDLMTEFSVGNIHFRHGSAKSREFFKNYSKKVGWDWSFQDMFYREYYRSGNDFIYRIESEIESNYVSKLNQTFGFTAKASTTLPVRYVILNPADIKAEGNISFANATYYKVLTDYELERLRNPRTPEDHEVLKSLTPEERKNINSKGIGEVHITLDHRNIIAVFYKKQSYESFGVPMGYPVLEDINFKKELRLMDQAIARTAQQAILLITMGAEPDKGGINPKAIAAMQKMFENESVARVVIADYTTKAQFVIPQIADILDPKKYEIVDRDIAIGLNNVLVGQGEKFANQHSKIEIFIERLKHARQAFLNDFLIPEMKRIAKTLGMKNFPEPFYEDIDLKDSLEYSKIYARLCELGILTPEETIEAIETGKLPTAESSVESQKKFKGLKDQGLYEPLMGKKMEGEGAGRPSGTKAPKSKVTVGPLKATLENPVSFNKFKDNLLLAQNLEAKITDAVKKKFKIKKLNETQENIVSKITEIIITNEDKDKWMESIGNYVESPVDKNPERVAEIQEIVDYHQTDMYTASLLWHSTIE